MSQDDTTDGESVQDDSERDYDEEVGDPAAYQLEQTNEALKDNGVEENPDFGPPEGTGMSEEEKRNFDPESVTETLKQKLYPDRYNATEWEAGDPVDTPDGRGVVLEKITEVPDHEETPDDLDASEDEPVYAVAMEDMRHGSLGGMAFFDADELAEREPAVDPEEAIEDAGSEEEDKENYAEIVEGAYDMKTNDWNPPLSWRKSEKPARLIALDVFTTLRGDFDKCTREFGATDGIVDDDRFCAAFFDYIYGHGYWRGDSVLPGA